jgi:VIT1/CCC1 family predicted Fe2+/Mn2+ transporter
LGDSLGDVSQGTSADARLGRRLILDELFDLSLYQALHAVAPPGLRRMLDELITVERRHFAFWQRFYGMAITRLDAGRRVKLAVIVCLCRLLGAPAMHLALEAIEVHGVRKYLQVWDRYREGPLGDALREVLDDEFKHEDATVGGEGERRINPERVRNIFLGLNDGLVEILGAVSGFFAAFGDAVTVLMAGLTVAVAGALSMAAGAYVATGSEAEVRDTETARRRFLGETPAAEDPRESALGAAFLVGASYFAGALVPVLPVLFGAHSAWPSVMVAGVIIVLVSMLLAFLSGMNVRRRILTNLVIIAAAVGVTYLIGIVTKAVFGIAV